MARASWPRLQNWHKLTLDNRIAPKTFEASYERYLNVALVHLVGRKAAETGKELMEKVLTHQRVNQKPGKKHGEELKPWIEMPNHGWSAAWH